MAIGFKPSPPERQPEEITLWTLAKETRRLTAYVHKIDAFDALELRYEIDGRLLESRMCRGAECARMKDDAETKRQESIAMGWSEPEAKC